MCEKDERCRRFLERTWPGIPIVPDIRDFDGTEWRGRFLLTGGVPCQPASRAGKQGGKADDRWLWGEAIRVVKEAQPRWCLFENPPGIYDVGIDGILSDLEGIGYETGIIEIPACAVNAPQIRQRVWIVGHSESSASPTIASIRGGARIDTDRRTSNVGNRLSEHKQEFIRGNQFPEKITEIKVGRSGQGDMADTSSREHTEHEAKQEGRDQVRRYCAESNVADTTKYESESRSARPSKWGMAETDSWDKSFWLPCADGKVRRAPDDTFGLVDGLHRSLLAALGNSIVPQVAYEIIKVIREKREK